MWENWDTGRNGVGRVGFGLMLDYSLLPFDEQQFLSDFVSPTGRSAHGEREEGRHFSGRREHHEFAFRRRSSCRRSASGSASSIGVRARSRTPPPTATSTAKQQHRSGGSVSIGGGLDKQIYDRFAVFGEAIYTYGYTSFGSGLAGSGSTCLTSGCDLLKNTPLGTLRGGLRVHVGR